MGFFDDIGGFFSDTFGGVSDFAGSALHDIAGLAGDVNTIASTVKNLAPTVQLPSLSTGPKGTAIFPGAIIPPALTTNNATGQSTHGPDTTHMLLLLAGAALLAWVLLRR